ncbi:hypothetical protein B0H14DRAFT_2829676 [Mycena olivaceomarginata]|nr:hypothetical protein B0H14DRAFT_2829676 [Mycena olivaceomarginata]
MGGMGAERIRPTSARGVDFDSILARLRDGVGAGVPVSTSALGGHGGTGPGSGPAPAARGPRPPPRQPPPQQHQQQHLHQHLHQHPQQPTSRPPPWRSSARGSPRRRRRWRRPCAPRGRWRPACRLSRARVKTIRRLLRATTRGALVPASASASSSSSLHTSTRALRAELAALRAEAAAVQVQRARARATRERAKTVTARAERKRERARTIRAGAYDGVDAAGGKGKEEKVHGHGHGAAEKNSGIGKKTETETETGATDKNENGGAQWALSATGTARRTKPKAKRVRPRLGVDLLEDLEIDSSVCHRAGEGDEEVEDEEEGEESDEEEEDGDDEKTADGGRAASARKGRDAGAGAEEEGEEEWTDDVDFRAEAAELDLDLFTPKLPFVAPPTLRMRGHGVFGVDLDADSEEQGFPAGLSAMHVSTSPVAEEQAGKGAADGEGGGAEEGQVKGKSEGREDAPAPAPAPAPEHLAALSAQLDVLSIQLGTLHGRLRALQEASPASPTTGFDASVGSEGVLDGGVEGGRLDGLDARVRALEGAVATSSASASAASALPSLPTPDPSPSIPAHATSGAAFRAEAAAFPPPVPPFALPPLPPAVAGGSAYAAGSGGGLLRRRREVYGADGDADASDASSSSLSDEPDAHASSYLRVRHAAEGSDESEDAPCAGGDAHSTATATSVLTPVAKTARSPWGLHRGTPSANGVMGVGADARDEPAVHPTSSPSERAKGKRAGKGKGTDAGQVALIVGAVGAGAMIVAAAWWGA